MKTVPAVAKVRHLFTCAGFLLALTVTRLPAADLYYVNDHLATTTAVTDAAGEIAAIEADAFGSPVAGTEQAARYTGKPYDSDIGAYVFPYRNYRSEEARWMSADPSGFPDGINPHIGGNPLSGIDPLGLAWVQSAKYSAVFYDNSNITNNQINGFESNLVALVALGNASLTGMVNQLVNSKNNLQVSSGNGSAAGGRSAGVNAAGGWDGGIRINFGSNVYSDVSLLPSSERPSSVLITLAHELSHGILDTYDPPVYAIGYTGPEKTAVYYENLARVALNQPYRPSYHGEKLNAQGYRVE